MKKSNLDIKDDCVILSVNPKIYPLGVVYSAAYVFLDRAYILLDGDPEKEILVELKPKGKEDLENFGRQFNNELLNYADYKKRAESTKKIREILLQRALFTNDPSALSNSDSEFDGLTEDLEDDEYLDDPEGIAIPWEEKYGKKDKGKIK